MRLYYWWEFIKNVTNLFFHGRVIYRGLALGEWCNSCRDIHNFLLFVNNLTLWIAFHFLLHHFACTGIGSIAELGLTIYLLATLRVIFYFRLIPIPIVILSNNHYHNARNQLQTKPLLKLPIFRLLHFPRLGKPNQHCNNSTAMVYWNVRFIFK